MGMRVETQGFAYHELKVHKCVIHVGVVRVVLPFSSLWLLSKVGRLDRSTSVWHGRDTLLLQFETWQCY